jgi:hypothetical protein
MLAVGKDQIRKYSTVRKTKNYMNIKLTAYLFLLTFSGLLARFILFYSKILIKTVEV